ncbi:MAG TPA: polyprenyl synthetase family protein [Candidatus Cloacimonadota bacterium]|jgi:geranylgeranyl diphosphate synthase type II|nr:polyprenyl synthetase family protein [Candidatus Cloacimonadota bacterium]
MKAESPALKKHMREKKETINIILDRFLPRKDDYPKEIHKAMRHTLFAGGKRVRPYLTLLVYNLYANEKEEMVIQAGSAIEMLHTYTLIHDDLPEIDNDEYRRGKKTCHVLFGADIALLAGDALLVEAFNMVNELEIKPETKINMIADMAEFTGDKGLIAGQMMDILNEGYEVKKKTVEFIHLNKTAKLIQLCCRFGAYMANAPASEIKKVDEFGKKIGLAFQIIDDILDIEGTSSKLGKTAGKDIIEKKATYPAVLGMEKSKKMAKTLIDDALKIIEPYGKHANLLKDFTLMLAQRDS